MSWYEEAFPKRPKEMPPTLKMDLCETYIVTFKERTPRNVMAGYRRLTPVINVECQGKPYTLFLSNVDLARRIYLVEEKLNKEGKTLRNLTLKIHKKKGPKRNYFYDLEEV